MSGTLLVPAPASSSRPPRDDEGTLATGVPGVSCIHVVPCLQWARAARLLPAILLPGCATVPIGPATVPGPSTHAP